MKRRFKKYSIPNVEILPTNFLDIDPTDPYFENVSYILCEPPSSGTAIADQFGYIMQEEGDH